ncbi:hypothetical protein MKW94_018187 [Papaver nudicaule]|uniref:Urease n=1 Tax=Papaver nudicaule TaxID=74823 RepID=A0AA41V240_PAPNU|nr:hypothetical protein [Papaver nudicaule]
MKLTPRDLEKLCLHRAGYLAQKRLASGLQLNYTEAVALIATQILEFVRDGDKTVAELMDIGKLLLGRRLVLPSVPHLLHMVQVEGTFQDGTKLITVRNAIASENGNLELALHGSFLPVPSLDDFSTIGDDKVPGQIVFATGEIVLNNERPAVILKVVNTADRPVQVGSHFHFIEVNPYLVFDRSKAYGMRLNIPAGTAVRFEPGEAKSVTLVRIVGRQVIRGGNGIVDGPFDVSQIAKVMEVVRAKGFGHKEEAEASESTTGEDPAVTKVVSREAYASMYGPTTGDKIRLGDTDLFAEIERDFAVYGDECVFGGGKVLRDGMGQASGYPSANCLDMVITNVVIIDYTGVYKADVGIKDRLIVGIGKSGNPDVMHGVEYQMIVGVNTVVIAGEGLILTAGCIDCQIHLICPQQADTAISSGITTLVGGGTGPAHIKLMLQSTDSLPLNFGFTGKGNSSHPEGLDEIIKAGAMSLKLHEDWGTTPAAIDSCLSVADKFDVQVNIHTDTLNESGCVEHTILAFKDRTIHTYHSEGAGGGHAPDIIKVCGEKNVLPSSTNSTRPFTSNTVDEHLDMLMISEHLDKNIPEDVSLAESRIRAQTIAAEDILHDMGAISIISSGSQSMGRIGEVITRTWQTAHKMKIQRGQIGPNGSLNDNFRIRRYIAKYTINPAIANGFSEFVGSVEVGKYADLVLWKPSFFGAKPEMVIKGGQLCWANTGDPNASIPTPEPVKMRPMFGAFGDSRSSNSISFVSKAAKKDGIGTKYGLKKRVEAVRNVRKLTKHNMKLNSALPKIEVDPEEYTVRADGEVLKCEPAIRLPLSRNYSLF